MFKSYKDNNTEKLIIKQLRSVQMNHLLHLNLSITFIYALENNKIESLSDISNLKVPNLR